MQNNPVYIFGPCSAENREQVLLTAGLLKKTCGDVPFIYRAGAWKPRTNPGSFQGCGEQALTWLADVKQIYHIPVATEVATPEHVEAAIEAGIDYLWIGARTSANPIAVENLKSKVVQGKIKGILVKNPVNEDAALWLGNIERMEKTGVPVMAVHRGCGHKPAWRMAHIVRQARPDIPMLLDPSHMSGEASKIAEWMSKVPELGLNGAMIEVHCDPKNALSDAKQQIKPEQLGQILDSNLSRYCLVSLISPSQGQEELYWLRAEIDELDEQLWTTIAKRMEVSQRIGEWKKKNNVNPLQPQRFAEIVEQREKWAEQKGLPKEMVKQILEIIHQESLRRQK